MAQYPFIGDDALAEITWRFYSSADQSWRWQRLGSDKAVVESSSRSYLHYEACVADAEQHGYHFMPSPQSTRAPSRLRKPGRFSGR